MSNNPSQAPAAPNQSKKRAQATIFSPHQTLGGNYEITEQIGEGGMAVVYSAIQISLKRKVAIKAMHPRFSEDAEFIARFEAEAGALAALQHPNIINIIDRGIEGGIYYFVMEFVDGEDLDHKIVDNRLAPNDWREIVSSCGAAFEYVHRQGIIHKDIKPSNILINKDGHVKVGDFGIAHIATGDANQAISADRSVGTRHYMAPEQEQAPGTVDHRADIFSLAVTFYKMLTRRMPVDDYPLPSEVNPAIPVAVDDVIERGMAPRREDRYSSVKEFCDALGKALREKSVNMSTMFKSSSKVKVSGSLYGGTDFQRKASSTGNVKVSLNDSTSGRRPTTGSGTNAKLAMRSATTATATVSPAGPTAVDTAVHPAAPSSGKKTNPLVIIAIVAAVAIAGIVGGILLLMSEPPNTPAPQRSILTTEYPAISSARAQEEFERQQNEARLQAILSDEIIFIEEPSASRNALDPGISQPAQERAGGRLAEVEATTPEASGSPQQPVQESPDVATPQTVEFETAP